MGKNAKLKEREKWSNELAHQHASSLSQPFQCRKKKWFSRVIYIFQRKTYQEHIGPKSLARYFPWTCVTRARIWKGDTLIADIEELEQMEASEIYARRLSAKEVFTPMRSDNFKFPVADGTVKISGEDQRLRKSTLIRDRPDRREEQDNPGYGAAEVFIDFAEELRHTLKPIQRVKFTKAIARHTKIRDQNPSLGYICPGQPHQRSPNAPKFEDRSQEETEWQEQGAREVAWRLAKNILKLKEKIKQHSSHLRKIGACLHQR